MEDGEGEGGEEGRPRRRRAETDSRELEVRLPDTLQRGRR